jgi:MFS family permease
VIVRVLVLVAVFGSGAALMSMEMAGFRLFQPEFGSNIGVWGSVISVFLAGLALGAYVGGRVADRLPAFWLLGLILAAAGVIALVIPLAWDAAVLPLFSPGKAPLPEEIAPRGDGGLRVYEPPDPRWPALGAGVVLFFIPSLLLGGVSPYAAKLLIHRLGRVGAGVGVVSGISTAGAILGTLGTAFELITWMGTRWLLATNGLVLIGLGVMLVVIQFAAPRHPPAAGSTS